MYAKSIEYGKVIWVIVGSEYSNKELTTVLFYAKEYEFDETRINADKNIADVLDKSIITIMLIENSENIYCNSVSLKELEEQYFKRHYLRGSLGMPIFVRWQYVHDNRIPDLG